LKRVAATVLSNTYFKRLSSNLSTEEPCPKALFTGL